MPDNPIVVMEGSNLLFFSSRTAAEDYLEPIDVEAGEYTGAFDADGNSLLLRVVQVDQPRPLGFGRAPAARVRIDTPPHEGLSLENARSKLVEFLRQVDPGFPIDPAASTRELVMAAVGRYRVY